MIRQMDESVYQSKDGDYSFINQTMRFDVILTHFNNQLKFIIIIQKIIISMNHIVLLLLLTFLLLHPAHTKTSNKATEGKQQEEQQQKQYLTQNQAIKLAERTKKNNIEIEKNRYQIYNFLLNNTTNFLIKEEATNIIKITFDVFWNQNSVYMQAAVLKTEEISLRIIEVGNKTPLVKQQFFTTNGVQFKAEGGKTYEIQLRQHKKSKRTKFIMMHMTEIIYIKKAVKKAKMQKIQQKMQSANRKLENSFRVSSVGNMLENSITKQVLHKSTLYSYFQIIQTIIILIFSSFLIKFIKKLLQNDIIV